ncbi:MAG: hypothetical protein AB1454_05275 [Candidatus Auribacterota bacterium]|jgi:hypothetical protein|uniref:Uncharacterized protein n=1 Tax=Candidatus Auribacter fodinae TaxID=2093366 RepID=A0A3A4RBS0_9BACT|nr:MAG: hypothetical protein C4541_00055 [Candidatus Auribacter fodinae]
MDGFSHDLISRIDDPPRARDYQKQEAPDRVQLIRDRDRQQQQQQQKQKRQQKQFSADDPHVDLRA